MTASRPAARPLPDAARRAAWDALWAILLCPPQDEPDHVDRPAAPSLADPAPPEEGETEAA